MKKIDLRIAGLVLVIGGMLFSQVIPIGTMIATAGIILFAIGIEKRNKEKQSENKKEFNPEKADLSANESTHINKTEVYRSVPSNRSVVSNQPNKQLDECVTPNDFDFVPVLKEKYYYNILTVYCGKEISDINNLLIYQNENPKFFESSDYTVLITIKSDNFYKMESVVARLENGNIQFKKNAINLPKHFYNDNLSNISEFIYEHKTELPFISNYNFTNSVQIQWILGQLRKICLYENEAYSVCVIPSADGFGCDVELQRKKDNTTDVVSLNAYYFAIFEQKDLAEKIIELLKVTDSQQKADVKATVQKSKKLKELFRDARKSFVCHQETEEVNPHAVKLVEKLKNVNAFLDIYERVIDYSRYDGISGVPQSCNYIKMYENTTVSEVLRQYLTLKEADAKIVFDWRSENCYTYSIWMLKVLRPWQYDSTYIFVNDSNMLLPKDELESIYHICKENSIHLIKNVNGEYYDYINDCYFKIVGHEYPGSADDAATYCDYEFETVEKQK